MRKDEMEVKIVKLPRWVRDHIGGLESRIKELESCVSVYEGTVSPWYTRDYLSTGEWETRYFPVGRNLHVQYDGVDVDITLPSGAQGRHGVEIRYSGDKGLTDSAILRPTGYQTLVILPIGIG